MNKIGYKSPPKHSQFKKGQSGNPKGRPKKDNENGIFAIFEEPITIRINGKNMKVRKIDAYVYRLLNDSLKGDNKASNQILKLPFIDRYFKIKESEGLPPVNFIVRGIWPGQAPKDTPSEGEDSAKTPESSDKEDSSKS